MYSRSMPLFNITKVDNYLKSFLFPAKSEIDFLLLAYLLTLLFGYVLFRSGRLVDSFAGSGGPIQQEFPYGMFIITCVLGGLTLYTAYHALRSDTAISARTARALFIFDSFALSFFSFLVIGASFEKSVYTSPVSAFIAALYMIRAFVVLSMLNVALEDRKRRPGFLASLNTQVLDRQATKHEVAVVFLVGGSVFVWGVYADTPLSAFLLASFITALVLSIVDRFSKNSEPR